MDCARAQELLSDHVEGTLDALLEADLAAHLPACAECRELRDALAEVMAALRAYPDLEPPASLADRAAAAALARPRLVPVLPRPWPGWPLPRGVQAVAAALAVATSAGLFLAQRSAGDAFRAPARLVERAVNAGAYLLERKERVVEDFHILRVVIGTALEGRMDRINDRVDDYRRLLERRRSAEQERTKSQGTSLLSNRQVADSVNPPVANVEETACPTPSSSAVPRSEL